MAETDKTGYMQYEMPRVSSRICQDINLAVLNEAPRQLSYMRGSQSSKYLCILQNKF